MSDSDNGCLTIIGYILGGIVILVLFYYMIIYGLGIVFFIVGNFSIFLVNSIRYIYQSLLFIFLFIEKSLFVLPFDPIVSWGILSIIISVPISIYIATKNLRKSFKGLRLISFIFSIAAVFLLAGLSYTKNNVDYLIERGYFHKNNQNYQEAIKYFTVLYNLYKMEEYIKERAYCYLNLNNYELALNDFNNLLVTNPKTEYLLQRAYCLEKLGDLHGALNDYKKLTNLNDTTFYWFNNKIYHLNIMIKETEAKNKVIMKKEKEKEKENLSKKEIKFDKASFATINTFEVELRNNYSVNSKVISILRESEEVIILDKIRVSKENEGILIQELRINSNVGEILLKPGKIVNILGRLGDEYLISINHKDQEIMANIQSNALKLNKMQDWYKIKTKSGVTGWILGYFISQKEI